MIAHALDAIVALTALVTIGAGVGCLILRPAVFDRLMGESE